MDDTENKNDLDGRDMSRHVATEPEVNLDMSGHVQTKTSSSAHTSLDTSRYTLSVEDVSELFARADIPRTPRTITRYCREGHLDFIVVDTDKNKKFLIDAMSVEKRIKELQQAFSVTKKDGAMSGHTQTKTSNPVQTSLDMSRQEQRSDERETTARAPESILSERERVLYEKIIKQLEDHVEITEKDKAVLIEQLKTKDLQMQAKDEQIAHFFASEKDTKRLFGSLQNLMSYLWPGAKREPQQRLPQAYGPIVDDIPDGFADEPKRDQR